jgi:mRNA interferase MazF
MHPASFGLEIQRMHRRLNITPPEKTIRLLGRVARRVTEVASSLRRSSATSPRSDDPIFASASRRGRCAVPSGTARPPRTGSTSMRRHHDGADLAAPPARRDLPAGCDPTAGAEIRKTGPVLILQNDLADRTSPITIVAAITSCSEAELHPTESQVSAPEGGLGSTSVVLLNQNRSIDARRLVRRSGKPRRETIAEVDRALEISLGLVAVRLPRMEGSTRLSDRVAPPRHGTGSRLPRSDGGAVGRLGGLTGR